MEGLSDFYFEVSSSPYVKTPLVQWTSLWYRENEINDFPSSLICIFLRAFLDPLVSVIGS